MNKLECLASVVDEKIYPARLRTFSGEPKARTSSFDF